MPRQIALRRSPIHGNGVFAAAPIAPGTTLVRYRGRLLTHAEADEIYADTIETGHTFLFTLNDEYVIDANVDGNIARWINHSCAPNCLPVLVEDARGARARDKVEIEAKRAIRAGEELTYDYGITLEVPHTARMKALWACRCGARNCTGTMLKPKVKAPAAAKAKAPAKTKSRVKAKASTKASSGADAKSRSANTRKLPPRSARTSA